MINTVEKILHPTDFSEPAQNAFTHAVELAHKFKAKLLVMHVAKTPYNYGAEKLMEETTGKNRYQDLSIESVISFGNTIPNILRTDTDLIVMGSKGKSNMEKMLVGSVTAKVVQKSHNPVLIIPPDSQNTDFNHIIFATDYNNRDLVLLEQLTGWAEPVSAKVTVLHVADEDNLKSKAVFRGFREIAAEKITYPHLNFELIIEEDFHTGISAFLHGEKKALIAMSRNKKTFFQSLFEEKHIQQTVYVKVPLLVLPGNPISED